MTNEREREREEERRVREKRFVGPYDVLIIIMMRRTEI